MADGFVIKDSGERQAFAGGMVRDTAEGKTDFTSVRFGPMYRRWAEHTTKGRAKYPDPFPGVPNWTLAEGVAEFLRARESLLRHMEAYLEGQMDEDHAAGVFFNINLMEYAREAIEAQGGTVPFIFQTKPRPEPQEPAPVMSPDGIDVGSRVRVVTNDSFSGKEGVVVDADGGYFDLSVVLDGLASTYGFNRDELERVGD